MTDLRLYEVINPSDKITFRASREIAGALAASLRPHMLFVRDVETGKDIPPDETAYDDVWKYRAQMDEYANTYDSWLIDWKGERATYEAAVATMNAEQRTAYRAEWNEKRCTGRGGAFCQAAYDAARRIRLCEPEPATATAEG